MMRSCLMCLLALLFSACGGPMKMVATKGQVVNDPEYVGFYKVLGEEHLSRREYRRAWNEFVAIADFEALRRLIAIYATDVEAFDREMLASMLGEYALGYVKQFSSANPLKHFRGRLHEIVDQHRMAGSLRRLRMAWAIERAYFDNLRRVEDRKSYYPTMVELQQQAAASRQDGVQELASEIETELRAIKTAYHWGE